MNETEPMLQFFKYAHLPPHLQVISKPFGDLAEGIVANLPRNPERTVALRKLLESKDCAVRAQLYQDAAPARPQMAEHVGGVTRPIEP